MPTKLELTERRRKLARLLAAGATKVEAAQALGVSRATIYTDLKAYQQDALELVDLSPAEEAAAIQHELDKLEGRRARAERVLEERTLPGSKEYSALLGVIAKLDAQLANLRMELGLWRKAPQRVVGVSGTELAGLEGEELAAYVQELDEKDAELAEALNPRRRGKFKRSS